VTTAEKFLQMVLAIMIFVAIVGAILLLASRVTGRRADRIVALLLLLPVTLMLGVGLLYPGIRTVIHSLFNADGSSFVGLENYLTIFKSSDQLVVLRNTALWVVITPFIATAVGLLFAILVDRARLESFAKALIFLPMAISFVSASIIWKFVYDFRPDQPGVNQIGLLNQVLVAVGLKPQQWLINSPLNTLLLVVVMVWIQAGFAMTVLSAAIKAIPDDIIEAARLDGVNAWGMFRFVTLPSIRPTVVVVLTAIGIGTLKVFDVVRTMTGGNFNTSVLAYEYYSQTFRAFNEGLGAALAVLLFVLVVPIVVYNVRQLRASEGR
jgi:alpha-glucoside transport system permease protein